MHWALILTKFFSRTTLYAGRNFTGRALLLCASSSTMWISPSPIHLMRRLFARSAQSVPVSAAGGHLPVASVRIQHASRLRPSPQ